MKWLIDDDGDIALTFWMIVTFVKYKHSVIVVWFWNNHQWKSWKPAPKWVREVK